MKNQRIGVEYLPLDDLRLDPANPRRIPEQELESLTRSVREWGFVDPVIARREDRLVIGGHQRLVAARRLGMETVPVVLVDLSLEQARALNVALNRISGEFDEQLLGRLIADLDEHTELDLTLTGLGDDELQRLLRSLDQRERREREETFDIDEATEQALRGEPRTQPGDLWLLGQHRLVCGDATDADVLQRLLDGGRPRMAFTDPPYNVALGDHGGLQQGSRRRRIANDALPREEWEAFCRAWTQQLVDCVDGALYVCMSSKEWPLVARLLEEVGGHWSDTLIWIKDVFVLGRADYQRQYEPIWYGWRAGAERYWCGDRDQGNAWRIPRPRVARLHPTMKPLALVERAIENSSEPGDAVLDPFLGSGTTLVACERTGRRCYAVELEPQYVEVAVARWESFTGERARMERAAVPEAG